MKTQATRRGEKKKEGMRNAQQQAQQQQMKTFRSFQFLTYSLSHSEGGGENKN